MMFNDPMLQALMDLVGIPQGRDDLGEEAVLLLAECLEGWGRDEAPLPVSREVFGRICALSELCLFLGADERVKKWAQGIQEDRSLE